MSYLTPENVLKNANELRETGNYLAALEEMHAILHGKKFRGNNIILERVMVSVGISPLRDALPEKILTPWYSLR